MKKKILLFLLFVIQLNVQAAVLTNQVNNPDYSVHVDKVGSKLRVTYTFDSVAIIPDPVFAGLFNLNIAGFGNSSEEAKPALPILLERFAIPANCTYSVNVIEEQYSTYNNIKLAPARPAISETSPYTFLTVPVEPIAISDRYEPFGVITDCGPQIFKKQQIANIRVSPIAYNSALNSVRICDKLCFEIEFIENGTSSELESDIETDYFLKSITLQPTDNSAANKAQAKVWDSLYSRPAEIDYLVLTADVLRLPAIQFANWKRNLGYNVTLLSEAIWSKDMVSNAISSWYSSSANPCYVILFGDADHINPHTNFIAPSDFKYACMDGEDDIIPDFCIGRIPATNTLEAFNAVNKICAYEANPLGDMTETKVVYATYFQDEGKSDGIEGRDFTRTTEMIYNAFPTRFGSRQRIYYCHPMVNPTRWSLRFSTGLPIPSELRKPGFAWDGDAQDIISAINNGCNLFFHRDHGEIKGWGDPAFKTSDLAKLKNTNYPIVLSIDCLTGKYTKEENFAKTMLCMPNAGCATIIAASENTYSGQNDAMVCSMFGSLFPEEKFSYNGNPNINSNASLFNGRASSIGEMLNIGLLNMERQYSNDMLGLNGEQRERYHCFGDPSLAVCWYSSKVLEQNASITEFGGYITVDMNGYEAYISFFDALTQEQQRVYGNYATFETTNPEYVFISVTRPGWVPLIGNYGQIRTMGTDNPKDNYIESYELISNTLLVNVIVDFDVSFGSESVWKLNTYIQSGANAVLISSLKAPLSGTPAVVQLPEIKNGDIVRLTLTCGNKIIDKKAILIRK